MKKRLEEIETQFQSNNSRMRNMEVDNDAYEKQQREFEYTIKDLEEKLESSLE